MNAKITQFTSVVLASLFLMASGPCLRDNNPENPMPMGQPGTPSGIIPSQPNPPAPAKPTLKSTVVNCEKSEQMVAGACVPLANFDPSKWQWAQTPVECQNHVCPSHVWMATKEDKTNDFDAVYKLLDDEIKRCGIEIRCTSACPDEGHYYFRPYGRKSAADYIAVICENGAFTKLGNTGIDLDGEMRFVFTNTISHERAQLILKLKYENHRYTLESATIYKDYESPNTMMATYIPASETSGIDFRVLEHSKDPKEIYLSLKRLHKLDKKGTKKAQLELTAATYKNTFLTADTELQFQVLRSFVEWFTPKSNLTFEFAEGLWTSPNADIKALCASIFASHGKLLIKGIDETASTRQILKQTLDRPITPYSPVVRFLRDHAITAFGQLPNRTPADENYIIDLVGDGYIGEQARDMVIAFPVGNQHLKEIKKTYKSLLSSGYYRRLIEIVKHLDTPASTALLLDWTIETDDYSTLSELEKALEGRNLAGLEDKITKLYPKAQHWGRLAVKLLSTLNTQEAKVALIKSFSTEDFTTTKEATERLKALDLTGLEDNLKPYVKNYTGHWARDIEQFLVDLLVKIGSDKAADILDSAAKKNTDQTFGVAIVSAFDKMKTPHVTSLLQAWKTRESDAYTLRKIDEALAKR